MIDEEAKNDKGDKAGTADGEATKPPPSQTAPEDAADSRESAPGPAPLREIDQSAVFVKRTDRRR